MVGLQIIRLATKALMPTLERSPKSGDERCVDGARTRFSAMLPECGDGWVLSRRPLRYGSNRWRTAPATTAAPVTSTPWSARTSVALR
jgi:hypothetical protein